MITSPLLGLLVWLISLPCRLLAEVPQLLTSRPEEGRSAPRVEAHEGDRWFEVRVEAPGVDPTSDVDLTASKSQLTVGVRRVRSGAFERSVSLPEDANPVDITTTYDAGILHVWVPLSGNAQAVEQPLRLPVTH